MAKPDGIYFSILAREALTPGHFNDTTELAHRVLDFQHEFATTAQPFDWTFTRNDLSNSSTSSISATGLHPPLNELA